LELIETQHIPKQLQPKLNAKQQHKLKSNKGKNITAKVDNE
jgi:hypothetical protein